MREDKLQKTELCGVLDGPELRATLCRLYGADAVDAQLARYRDAVIRFEELFGKGAEGANGPGSTPLDGARLFRAPGRIEIGGNHTDHQHGQVLAAAIDLDAIGVAAASGDDQVRIYSEGFGWIEVDLSGVGGDGTASGGAFAPGTPEALVYGVAAELQKQGYEISGFRAYVTSNVPEGAGLSSSAAFEILVGVILSGICNDGTVSREELAHIAQNAENCYYGKPCGLMDQMAIAMGGICHINFKDPASPDVQKLDVDFPEMGYSICITDTHGSHAEHTDDYAAVQTDLQKAASVFGKQVMGDVSRAEVIEYSAQIREVGGDRAFLRAMHVAAENERVRREADALKRKDMQAFLFLVRRSGDSSYKLLQNVYTDRTPEKQELAVALAVSEAVLINNHTAGGVLDAAASSACRVHGGGFAGTIEAFVPEEEAGDYKAAMDEVFGEGSCFFVKICPEGGMEV